MSGALSKPTHAEISAAAYQIYEEEGCPNGYAESHWHEGERRLQREALISF